MELPTQRPQLATQLRTAGFPLPLPAAPIAAPTAVSPGTSLPSSPELSPIRDVPGEVFIGQDETAGLPGRDLEEYAHSQAKRVVRAHKLNFLKFRGKHKRGRSRTSQPLVGSEGQGKGKDKDPARRGFLNFSSRDPSRDVEKSAEGRAERGASAAAAPKGVLSALLSIYEPASALQSGATTPARSSMAELSSSRPGSLYMGPASAASSAPMMPPGPPSAGSSANAVYPSNGNGAAATSTASFRPPNHPWTRTFGFGDARPPKSTSAAGVFGPLIASAGNITGVAAPMQSTVAPDLKRPGYHLSRSV